MRAALFFILLAVLCSVAQSTKISVSYTCLEKMEGTLSKDASGTCKSTANCSKATVNKAGLKTVKIWGCTSCVDFKKNMVAYDASVDVECKECDTRADLCNKDL